MHFCSTVVFVFLLFIVQIQSEQQIVEDDFDYESDYSDEDFLSINGTTSTSKKIFTTKTNSKSIPSKTTRRMITPFVLVSRLVEQFNHFRHVEILNRMKFCDSTMKLNEICETFSFDNHTYALLRDFPVEFPSLQNVFDALVNRLVVENLSKSCSTGRWCLKNLTQEDIRFTFDVLRQKGRSFCSLAKCHHRLSAQISTCPKLFPQNLSIPTVKMMPMLCVLSQEATTWNSKDCIQRVAHLLHLLYAFWPKIETCHRLISTGSTGCTVECLTFNEIFHQVENQCHRNASFLLRVPVLSWYRSTNLKQLCRHESISSPSPFISTVKDFFSSNTSWYNVHHHQIYVTLFVIVIVSIVISFAICLYCMSQNSDSETCHLDDSYEYTRLQDTSYELANTTEIPNGNSRPTENRRLLYLES